MNVVMVLTHDLPEGLGLTYDQLVELFPPDREDGRRYELFGGVLTVSPGPTRRHQAISLNLAVAIGSHVTAEGLGVVYCAPIDVIFSPRTMCDPDLVFVSDGRRHVLSDRGLEGAPDLVVEILSPSTRTRDLGIKRERYGAAGVREYWVVDATTRTVNVYRLSNANLELAVRVEDDGTLTTPMLPGLAIRAARIFDDNL